MFLFIVAMFLSLCWCFDRLWGTFCLNCFWIRLTEFFYFWIFFFYRLNVIGIIQTVKDEPASLYKPLHITLVLLSPANRIRLTEAHFINDDLIRNLFFLGGRKVVVYIRFPSSKQFSLLIKLPHNMLGTHLIM